MAKKSPQAGKKRIMVLCAHQDDCEIKAGGIASLWTRADHTVRFVSATNGGTGHHAIGGIELVRRRIAEAEAGAKTVGADSVILDIPNGEVEPTIVYRRMFIRMIREFKPDLILTHRPNDYHPDHRYTSQLVQDSSYVVTVPNNTPGVEALREAPCIAYLSDSFQKPTPFVPDVVVGIDDVIEKKIDAMHCHVSQFYEWLPWNKRIENEVPKGDRQRRAWMRERRIKIDRACADKYRDKLIERYGEKKGSKIEFAEAFEGCEYGSPLDAKAIAELFPF